MTGLETGYEKDVSSPLAVATLEASYGAEPFASTKIVALDVPPAHSLTTCTVERSWMFVIVQVMVAPPVAGAVDRERAAGIRLGRLPCPAAVDRCPIAAGTATSPTLTGVDRG